MKRRSEFVFDRFGNPIAKATLAIDAAVSEWSFTKSYESSLFEWFFGEFSSIVDKNRIKEISAGKKHMRPLTLSVTLRRIKLKKTYIYETVSCDRGGKNLYKSRVIHVFRKDGEKIAYCGTRKKAIAEKNPAKSNISAQNT